MIALRQICLPIFQEFCKVENDVELLFGKGREKLVKLFSGGHIFMMDFHQDSIFTFGP